MKKILFIFWLTLLFGGCQKSAVGPTTTTDPNDPAYAGSAPAGEWKADAGGAGGFEQTATTSFKNFQYSFTVAANNPSVSVELSSPDTDVQYTLFDPLGQPTGLSGQGRKVGNSYKLGAGTYRIVVAAGRQAVGKFTLLLTGIKDGVTRLTGSQLQSNAQDWGTLGGGGRDISFKNHFYTVDITDDNSSIDVELESADTDISLALFDGLGTKVYAYNGGRYLYTIQAVKKGTYTVMAGTNTRGGIGKYNLRITGKVANLKRVESQTTTVTGKWDTSSPASTTYPNEPYAIYSLRLTSASSTVDAELSSPDVSSVILRFQSDAGTPILTRNLVTKSIYLVTGNTAQGTYQIKVYPSSKQYGNYTLTVFGQFADFKKL